MRLWRVQKSQVKSKKKQGKQMENLEKEYKKWLENNNVKVAKQQYVDFVKLYSDILNIDLFNIKNINNIDLLENFNNSKKKLNDDERSKFRKFIKFCASKHLLEEAEFSFEAIKRKHSIEQIAFFHFEKEFKKEFKDIIDVSKNQKEFNKCGYDLVVITKENKKYNIEIKGLKDINNQFILSKNEYEKSDSDIYLICLVQNCKSLSSKVKIDFFKFVSGKWINVKFNNGKLEKVGTKEISFEPFQYLGKIK